MLLSDSITDSDLNEFPPKVDKDWKFNACSVYPKNLIDKSSDEISKEKFLIPKEITVSNFESQDALKFLNRHKKKFSLKAEVLKAQTSTVLPAKLGTCTKRSRSEVELKRLQDAVDDVTENFQSSATTTSTAVTESSSRPNIAIDSQMAPLSVTWKDQNTRVQFSTVEIRKYPMILGDNPCCPVGPPVSLGWEYEAIPSLSIDDYDALRIKQRRSRMNHMILTSCRRKEVLELQGVSRGERKKVERIMGKIRYQRAITKWTAPVVEPVETVVESGMRKIQRIWKKRISETESSQ